MDTLLEVGLVEALTAAVFVGFCLFVSYLLQPRKIYERRLARMLDQIAQPERSVPSQLTYRGAPYSPSFVQTKDPETATPPVVPSESIAPPPEPIQISQSVVRLSYRGVPYVQLNVGPESASTEKSSQ